MADEKLLSALVHIEHAAAEHLRTARERKVTSGVDAGSMEAWLARFDFAEPIATDHLLRDAYTLLLETDVDSTHPRYFGLFNPPTLPVTVAADAMVALLNPQVGTTSHAPGANQIEQHVLAFFCSCLGFPAETAYGHFTSGGQEANTTAVSAALARQFPTLASDGVQSLAGTPCFYVSELSHHSFVKAARLLGLGENALRRIPVDAAGCMDVDALRDQIHADRNMQDLPFMVVATAGTTGIGSIDPLPRIESVCEREGLWMHVDAAWGGSAMMAPSLRPHLAGIERADSVTWDAHKWLDVPMGAGMLLFSGRLGRASLFHVDTSYVPSGGTGAYEPYQDTMQWSRRFIGLKVFMALANLSADGYARLITQQAELGEILRQRLRDAGWQVVNDTPLPLVCFTHSALAGRDIARFAAEVSARGQVWISSVTSQLGDTLRACITSFDATEADIDVLLAELQLALAAGERPPNEETPEAAEQ